MKSEVVPYAEISKKLCVTFEGIASILSRKYVGAIYVKSDG